MSLFFNKIYNGKNSADDKKELGIRFSECFENSFTNPVSNVSPKVASY